MTRGLLDEHAGDGHPLLLPSGQRVDAPVVEPAEPDPGQGGAGPRHIGGREEAQQRAEPGRPREPADQHVLEHGEAALQVELLEHEADARRGCSRRRSAGGARDGRAADPDLAGGGRDETVQAAQERGLPGAARPDEGHQLAFGSMSRSTPSRATGAARILLAQAADADHFRRPAVKWKWTW